MIVCLGPSRALGSWETDELRLNRAAIAGPSTVGDDPLLGQSRFARWLFVNRKTGRITIAQAPNASILVFAGACLAIPVVKGHKTADRVCRALRAGALIVWAVDEIARGVNPWRRLLGASALAGLAIRRRNA